MDRFPPRSGALTYETTFAAIVGLAGGIASRLSSKFMMQGWLSVVPRSINSRLRKEPKGFNSSPDEGLAYT